MGVETTGYSGILCVGPRRGQLATVGRDGCARGREWQQLGQQQQQRRDSIRCVECYVDTATVLRHPQSDRSWRGRRIYWCPFCSSKDYQISNLMNFLIIRKYKFSIQRSLPLWRRLHCCFCCRHSLGGQCGNHNKKYNISTDLLEFKRPICCISGFYNICRKQFALII